MNSFFTDNSSILTPFEGAKGNYIRCGSIGGSPDWHRDSGELFGTSSVDNNYYYQSSNSAEVWHNTLRLARNQEVECRPNSSLNLTSGWIGLFFKEPIQVSNCCCMFSLIDRFSISLPAQICIIRINIHFLFLD